MGLDFFLFHFKSLQITPALGTSNGLHPEARPVTSLGNEEDSLDETW